MEHSSSAEAEEKIKKARRFLDSAELLEGCEVEDARTSLAAISAVNSSDAVQLLATDGIAKGSDHKQAVGRLRRAGHPRAAMQLGRALGPKSSAQYGTGSSSVREADETVKHATRLLRLAEELATKKGRPK